MPRVNSTRTPNLGRQLKAHLVRGAWLSMVLSLFACENNKSTGSGLPPPDLPERTPSGTSTASDVPPETGNPPAGQVPLAAADAPEPTGPEFDKFIESQQRLNTLRDVMATRMQEGEDVATVQQEFQEQATAVVRDVGLEPASYAQYAQMMQTKPEFRSLVQNEMQERNESPQ